MPLTDYACKQAKGQEKVYKLYDAKNLYLEVTPQGSKRWRLRYRLNGKENRCSLGLYPDITLKEAREKRDEIQKIIDKGLPPPKHYGRRHITTGETFEDIARQWLTRQQKRWSPKHQTTTLSRLENYIFPRLGNEAISSISPPMLLSILLDLEKAGTLETARRVRQIMGQVFRYAVAMGKADSDPSWALRGAIAPAQVEHFATITQPREVGQLLRDIDELQGSIVVRLALKFLPYVFVRPGELRHAEWAEIDLERAEWRIPAAKMKMRDAHIVPLSRQAIEILKLLKPVTGQGQYLFPSIRTLSRPMSENTVNVALKRLGYDTDQMVGHGFRSMASTLLNELGFRPDLIERQLAHAERNKVRAAYNRAEYLQERREMMQKWADYLDELKAAGTQ